MKKILASLLTAYVLTNGQAPPVDVQTAQAQTTTSAPATNTAAASAQTTAAQNTVNTQSASVSTSAPGTSAPVTTARQATTKAATTSAPIQTTKAATTTTAAPIQTTKAQTTTTTSAPVRITPAPVTPAPTLNPYCPLDAGQQSGIQPLQFNENRVCFMPTEIATDYLGRLRCDNFACCQCTQINCGFNGYPCEQLQIGDSGAVGVKSINVRGAPEMNNNPLQNIFGGNAFGHHGAKIECQGRESCMAAIIRGEMISEAQCSGDMGCQDTSIVINDPMHQMNMQCNGLMSCQRANIEINVGVAEAASRAPGQGCNPSYAGVVRELGKVEFNGQMAGAASTVTIRNKGCGTLLLDGFECMNLEACPGITVNIEGNVAVRHCDLMGVAPNSPLIQSLVAACQAGQNYNNWNFGNIPPQQPIFPQQPPQQGPPPVVIPPNPVNPNPTTPINPTPVNPTPVNPNPAFPGFGGNPNLVQDPRSTKLQCDQVGMPMLGVGMVNTRACAGTTQTIQIANNFVLDCSLSGACNGMTLTLNAGYDPTNPMFPVTRIDSLKFIQPQSDVTIYINNDFGTSGQPVRINDVRCEGPNRCRNLKIIAGPGVDIYSTNFDCQDMMSCIGATVQQGTMTMAMDPRTQGMPYNPYQGQGPIPYNPWI